MNALNGGLSMALKDAWIRIENDASAKVAVFSGAGKSFCASSVQGKARAELRGTLRSMRVDGARSADA